MTRDDDFERDEMFDDEYEDDDELEGMETVDLEADDWDSQEEEDVFAQIPQPTLEETLDALRRGEVVGLTSVVYYGLSDFEPANTEALREVWESLDPEYRLKVVIELSETSETNFELDYESFGLFALDDDEASVRAAAVDLLWTDETLEGMRRMIDLAFEDESPAVRAAAAGALGKYILLGEFDDLPAVATHAAVDTAFSLYRDESEDIEVRRRALESLGSSSRDGVDEAIQDGYEGGDLLMRVSAVYAMGKTYDEKWAEVILREMNAGDPAMRYEAARAAGEIGLEGAVPKLSRLVYEPDREIQEVAIWALGEIGGKEAMRVLRRLLDDSAYAIDEAMIEALEDALVSASLPGESLTLMELDDDEPPTQKGRWN